MADGEMNNMLKATLFIDSLTRSVFIPFGPILVYSFMQENPNESGKTWGNAVVVWGQVCASYVFGRMVGEMSWNKLSRFAGSKISVLFSSVLAIAALHLSIGLAKGAGTLMFIRCLSGFLGLVMCNFAKLQHEKTSQSDQMNRLPIPSSVMRCLGFTAGPLIGGMFWDDTAPRPLLRVVTASPAALSCVLTAAVVIGLVLVKAFFWYLDRDREGAPNESVELLSSVEEALESGMNVQPDMEMSERYIRVCKGNMVKAQNMWRKTQAWRAANDVANVLKEPQPHFCAIKRCYPHVLHGRTRKGELVCYEKPGCMNVKGLIEADVGPKEMGRHYTFMNELLYTKLLPGDEDQVMTVMDVGQFSMSLIQPASAGFLQATGEIMANHYPERVARVLVLNCPFWLPGMWNTVSHLLAPAAKEKFAFFNSSKSREALLKYLDADQIPSDYGGDGEPLGHAPEEQFVLDVVKDLNGADPRDVLGMNHCLSTSSEPQGGRHHRRSASTPLLQQISMEGEDPSPPTLRRVNSSASQPTSSGEGLQPVEFTRGRSSSTPGLRNNSNRGLPAPGPGGAAFQARMGLSQRLRNFVSRPFRRTPQAHLGQENKFVYDEGSRQWVLQAEAPLNGSQAEAMDEHGLILAIQAAHMRTGGADSVSGDGESVDLLGGAAPIRQAGPGDRSGEVLKHDYSKIIMMIVALLYGFWCGVQTAMEAVVPAWILTSTDRGGLGYGVPSVGVSVSFAAVAILLLLVVVIPHKLVQMPLRAPLRAIRLGTALQTFVMVCLPHVRKLSLDGTPNDAVMVWTLVILAITGIAIATASARSGSSILLALALKTVSKSPRRYVAAVTYIGEFTGPILGALIFCWSTSMEKPFPMDSTFCFNLCAVLSFGMYLLTLVVHLHVINDFGISDEIHSGYDHDGMGKCHNIESVFDIPLADVSNLIQDTRGRRSHYNLKDQ